MDNIVILYILHFIFQIIFDLKECLTGMQFLILKLMKNLRENLLKKSKTLKKRIPYFFRHTSKSLTFNLIAYPNGRWHYYVQNESHQNVCKCCYDPLMYNFNSLELLNLIK